MENVDIQVNGSKLVITIDSSVNLGASKSGKTQLVASTQGNKRIVVGGREIHLGINAYTK